jgi:hypothetical protein
MQNPTYDERTRKDTIMRVSEGVVYDPLPTGEHLDLQLR